MADTTYGTYGFRYSDNPSLALCNLFAVGYDSVEDTDYRWDGLTRMDGPLLLFQYTLSGEGIYEDRTGRHSITAGQAFLTEIPSDHRYYYPDGAPPWEFLFLLIRPQLVLPNWQDAASRLGSTPQLPAGSRPVRLLQQIYEEARAGRVSDPYLASSYVYQFVAELCRYSLGSHGDWPDKVKRAAQIIESRYSSMLSLEQLADELGWSKYHFLRMFSASVGMTPGDYLNRVRTERAMELLRGTSYSVEQIAEQVGYSSGSYFIKAFRRLTGLTPGMFRRGEELVYNRLFFD
jgi:AraC-like DNA-binding protein